jgi:hypothetical protein
VLLLACGNDAFTTTDSRYSTPERTIETLLDSCDLRGSSAENQAVIIEQGGSRIRDQRAYDACFSDIDQPGGQAMAGYVVGMVAGARDELRYETIEGRGYVIPREGIRIVMERDERGAYRIVLRESVPENVRRSILQLESSAPREPAGP